MGAKGKRGWRKNLQKAIATRRAEYLPVEDLKDKLHTHGYVIVRVFNFHLKPFSSADGVHTRSLIARYDDSATTANITETIFQGDLNTRDAKKVQGDHKRRQLHLDKVPTQSDPTLCRLISIRNDALKRVQEIFPHVEETGSVVLHSLPGCETQFVHTDGEAGELQALPPGNENMPLAALISIEERTILRVWPNSHRLFQTIGKGKYSCIRATGRLPSSLEPIPYTRVHIPPGHMIIFRRDLAHAGESYPESTDPDGNVRMHMYLDPKGYVRPDNTTGQISPSIIKYLLGAHTTTTVEEKEDAYVEYYESIKRWRAEYYLDRKRAHEE